MIVHIFNYIYSNSHHNKGYLAKSWKRQLQKIIFIC